MTPPAKDGDARTPSPDATGDAGPGTAPVRRGLYGSATVVLSSFVALIGIAIVVRTIAGGGGPVAQGILIGALFFAAGAGRAWMAWRGATLLQPRDDAGEGRSDG